MAKSIYIELFKKRGVQKTSPFNKNMGCFYFIEKQISKLLNWEVIWQAVWPDWAIFLHFGQLFNAFGTN